MAFIPTANTAKAVMRYAQFGRIYTNSVWAFKISGWTATELAALATNVANNWITHIRPIVSNSVALASVVAYDMSALDGERAEYTPSTGNVGALTSPALPGNVTLAISLQTGGRGKSARGRWYHVGLVESDVTANAISGTFQASLESAYIDFLTDVETTAPFCELVVVSFQLNNVVRTSGFPQPITNITVDTNVDSQRRRIKPV